MGHFHVHRVSAPLASLLDPTPPAQSVLTALAENCRHPSAATTVHEFPPLPDPAPCIEVTTAVLAADPLPDHPPSTRIATAYIVEDTLLPVVELLAGSEELLNSLADALAEEEPGEHLAAFLRALLVAGRRDAELALLPHPTRTPDGTDTTIFGLFSCAVADFDRAVLLYSAPDGPAGWESLRNLTHGDAARPV
jgi:hypothetical protein